MKQWIKSLTPPPVWRLLAAVRHRLANQMESVRRAYCVQCWKRRLAEAGSGLAGGGTMDVAGLQNRRPNSGGVAVDVAHLDPKGIAAAGYARVERRSSGVEGFEGLALDDALGWMEDYRHYSFVPLAEAVSSIACGHLSRSGFTVLELGCGWGGFRVLLKAFGATDYLGIDANPLAFAHSPFVREAPGSYRLQNLQEAIDFGVKFDVVCSFEVLEHIREDRLNEILQTIGNHLNPGSIFIGTAALTDYTDVHVTVHPRDWWLDRLRQHGLFPVDESQERVWLELLALSHPFNWTAESTSIFVLRKS